MKFDSWMDLYLTQLLTLLDFCVAVIFIVCSFLQKVFFLLIFYVYVFSLYICLCAMWMPNAQDARREHWMPWNWFQDSCEHHVGDRTWTQDLWKCSQGSWPVSHLSSSIKIYLFIHLLILILCSLVSCLHVCVCITCMHAWCPKRPKEGVSTLELKPKIGFVPYEW